MEYKYSRNFNPPAPVIEVSISAPLSKVSTSSTALIDSGAAITVIPERIIAQLKLRRVDSTPVSGFGKRVIEATVYSAALEIEGISESKIYRILGWSEDYALIGRDLLNQFIAVLNGLSQELSLR
ncbi:MAG: retroviral-like aspartic protease family protein [Dehalococcoidia bacterium]|nr:retroviral-like aspartic protease family protein [Dehalococcoidia bacterium]